MADFLPSDFPDIIRALIASFLDEHDEAGHKLRKYCGTACIKEIRNSNYYKNGVLHSFNDKPAKTIYFENSNLISLVIWYKDGLIHRDGDKPAVVDYYPDNTIRIKVWWLNGRLIRNAGGSTMVGFDMSGNYIEL